MPTLPGFILPSPQHRWELTKNISSVPHLRDFFLSRRWETTNPDRLYRVPASEGRVSSFPLAYPFTISEIGRGL